MSQITEIIEEKPSVLIVAKKDHEFVQLLKNELKINITDVFFSPILPSKLSQFEYCFLINEEELPKKKAFLLGKKIAFIFVNKQHLAQSAVKYYQDTTIKIIDITGDKISKNNIDKLLWFTLSKTKERYIHLTTPKNAVFKKKPWQIAKFKFPSKKKLILFTFLLLLIIHFAFVPPLLLSSYFFYQAATSFKQEKYSQAERLTTIGEIPFNFAKKLYLMPRSTYLFFSLTLIEDVILVNEKAHTTIQKLLKLQENAKEAMPIILNTNQAPEEKKLLLLRIETIKKDIDSVEDNLNVINQKLSSLSNLFQNIKKDLTTSLELISRIKPLLEHVDSLLAKDSKKTYLLLFANNMELRPGGGFIGSFGLLEVKDYSIEKIKIYDVYDADGQLIAHIEPPGAIRKYLNQPHWFLRDSAFSPDFLENYAQAKYFLEKEMNFTNFSGSFLLTTTAIQHILGAFDEIYLADFREKINQKNFYLKTQYYSEKDFFPGSIQKKNFLGSLTQSLLLNLGNASSIKLAREFKKSLDEKQIVLSFDDAKLQKVVDKLYWSGRTIRAPCEAEVDNCITDYTFPFDANLGLNKVNFFVTRSFDLKITIDKEGVLHNTFSVLFNNDSYNVFPGGTYRNFFQIFLPRNTQIKKITLDGTLVDDFIEENDEYKKVGLLIEVKPKSIAELKINYEQTQQLKKGKNVYQLIIQKQIGAQNSDLVTRLFLPKNVHLLNQNFPALVKDGQIIYNTTLTADKIFFVELIKE
ncbi:hypothetical protein A3F57_00600 [Candidatus Roizmanbacteria bacterium RIFCSPHIGHO2_12_FULL_36_11]|nr:MAG: hypothetical protein A3F57_00600 [Candidatus Roizmanbacteria bacterium RIFCSPHIGHO2_12_FULL_36_11]